MKYCRTLDSTTMAHKFSQPLFSVFLTGKGKNQTAFSNISNGLGEISQWLFSMPSMGNEKNPMAFPTLSSTPPTGNQRL